MSQATKHPSADVTVTRDVEYGQGQIGHGTATPGVRPLMLDIYAPSGPLPAVPRPALVIMA